MRFSVSEPGKDFGGLQHNFLDIHGRTDKIQACGDYNLIQPINIRGMEETYSTTPGHSNAIYICYTT